MSEIVSYYLLDRLEKAVKEKKESLKDGFKSRKASDELRLEGPEGLTVVVSDVAGRKSFDVKKAEAVLKANLPPYEFFNSFVKIKATPIKPLPPELLEEMRKYFILEEYVDATEEKVKASSLPEELVDGCYAFGEPTLKLTAPTKVSNKELMQIAAREGVQLIPELGV